MNTLIKSVLSWLCFPVYVVQGIWVRQQSLRLSPPDKGESSGQFGKGRLVRNVLIVGDSSAAGVGIDSLEGSIGYQLAEKLFAKDGKTTGWRVSGNNSAIAGEIRDIVLPNLEPDTYTHIFVMIGMNDTKNWHTVGRWKKEFGGLLYGLRARFPGAKIYWHQAIDMTQVPALPKPLSHIMNLRVALINKKGAQLCVERGAVCVPPLPETQPQGYCRDGFHANEYGYDVWSDHLIAHMDYVPRTSPAVQHLV